MTLSLMQAFEKTELAECHMLHLDAALDVKPKHRRQIDDHKPTYHETNQSYLRRLIDEELRISKLREITFVGVQGHRLAQQEVDLVQNCKAFSTKIVYCRRGHTDQLVESVTPGKELVSVDLSVVKSHFAAGVGIPSPAMGLSDT